MKKYNILNILAVALLTFSCADLDNISPSASVDPTLAFKDFRSAQAAVAGNYDEMQQDNFDKWCSLGQYFSDECDFTGTFPTRLEFGNLNVFPSNGTMATVFSSHYDAINVSNVNIEQIPQIDDVSIDDDDKNSFVGEARFIRALNYLYLTQGWGDVPLVLEATKPTETGDKLNVSTNPRSAILDQIEQDFEFAASNAPGGDNSRANPDAANGMLARVNLYRGNWQDAYDQAVGVLGEDFDLTRFTYLEDVLFQLIFTSVDGNGLNFFYGPSSLGGRHSIEPSADLIGAYEEGDIRFNLSIDTASASVPYGLKYDDFGGGSSAGTDPILFLRHSELCLIAAEAAAELGNFDDANRWYNMVRERAGLDDQELDGDNYVDLILQERFVELAMEGFHRLWDLRRRGRAMEVLGPIGYDACDDVWPLPVRDIDRNPNLVQNGCCNC